MAGPLRVMVLNVDVGAGHRRAGEALCAAFEALRPLMLVSAPGSDAMMATLPGNSAENTLNGGCSVTGDVTAVPWTVLTLLGLLALGRRRS